MMYWQELGLEPTDDIKLIKRAYSQKLKTIDRTHDIEGFQRLHQAYQAALAAVKGAPRVIEPQVEDAFDLSAVEAKDPTIARLDEALEVFFQEIAEDPEVPLIYDAYSKLQARFALGRDLLRADRMQVFLERLHAFLLDHPTSADARLLQDILHDLQLAQDIHLYQAHQPILRLIEAQAHLEFQRRVWLHQTDERTSGILLDPDLQAGYAWRRRLHFLPRVMNAIHRLESEFSLLIGPYIRPEKIAFWKEIDRTILFTYNDLANASWGFALVPVMVFAVTLREPTQTLMQTAVLLSYPLSLTYVVLMRRLRFKMETHASLRACFENRELRTWTLRVNATYALAVVALGLQGQGLAHGLAVIGLISLFTVLLRFSPINVLAIGTFLGAIAMGVIHPGQRPDLALAAQLGTGLFFLLTAISGEGRRWWNHWKPAGWPGSEGKPILTSRNIVLAVILVRIVAALLKARH